MPTPVNSVLVLVASPGDAAEERAAVRDALNDWNVTTGIRQGVVLLPWMYERHAIPAMGGRAQALINSQAVDRADIVVAFFDSRLGSSTGEEVSGTAEEIHRAVSESKPVHVYFSNEDLPRDVEVEQLVALNDFKKQLREEGLLGDYMDPSDLAGQVVRALQFDIDQSGWGQRLLSTHHSGANLSWSHEHEEVPNGLDNRGKMKMRTTRNALVVKNESDVDAVDLTFSLSNAANPDEESFRFDGPTGAITLYARSEQQWTLIPFNKTTVLVEAQWTENDFPKQKSFTVITR